MDNITLEYSKERKTWNVFVNGEWYYESTDYEQAEDVYHSFFYSDDDYEDIA